jgi:hypothetical protein
MSQRRLPDKILSIIYIVRMYSLKCDLLDHERILLAGQARELIDQYFQPWSIDRALSLKFGQYIGILLNSTTSDSYPLEMREMKCRGVDRGR